MSPIFITIFGVILGGVKSQFIHMDVPVSFDIAERICSAFPGPSYLVDDAADNRELRLFMETTNISSVWLGITRRDMADWTWVDGNKWTGPLLDLDRSNHRCGGVSTVTGRLEARKCSYGGGYLENVGVVCEYTGTCNGSQCFQESGNSYIFHCGVSNFYKARDICKDHGSVIDKLETQEKIDALRAAKAKLPSLTFCDFFWIGLRREDWYSTKTTEASPISSSLWDQSEPDGSFSCAAARFRENKLVWNAVNCEGKYAAVCMSKASTGPTDYHTARIKIDVVDRIFRTNTPGSTHVPDRRMSVPVIIGAVLGFVILAVVVLALIVIYRRRKRNNRDELESEKNITEWQDLLDSTDHNVVQENQRTNGGSKEEENEYIQKENDQNVILHMESAIDYTRINKEAAMEGILGENDQNTTRGSGETEKRITHGHNKMLHHYSKTGCAETETWKQREATDSYQDQNRQNILQVNKSIHVQSNEKGKSPGKNEKVLQIAQMLKPQNEECWTTFITNRRGTHLDLKVRFLYQDQTSVGESRFLGGKGVSLQKRYHDLICDVLGVDKEHHPVKASSGVVTAYGSQEDQKTNSTHIYNCIKNIDVAFISPADGSGPYTDDTGRRLVARKPHFIVDMTSKTMKEACSFYEYKRNSSVIIKKEESADGQHIQNVILPQQYFRLENVAGEEDQSLLSEASTWITMVACIMILWSAKGIREEIALRNTDNMRRILDHMRSEPEGAIRPNVLWEHLLDLDKILQILDITSDSPEQQ